MTPVEIIKAALAIPFVDADEDPRPWEMGPPLTSAEIAAFETRIPCPLPAEIRELLAFGRGISGAAPDWVYFLDNYRTFDAGELFPHKLGLAGDGFGNFWIIDLLPNSTTWGPIFYISHDPPVFLYQSPNLSHFLEELVKASLPDERNAIDEVHDDLLFHVHRDNPFVLSHEECVGSLDSELETFARDLGAEFEYIDLRKPEIGMGFTWARYGPEVEVQRAGLLRIFAVRKA